MTRTKKLWIVLLANLALVGALLGVGVAAHSLGVWAEGVDYLADAAAIGVTLLSMRLETPTPRRPEGRPRATRYAALLNAGWLLVLSGLVSVGAVIRLASGARAIDALPVLVTSAVAAAVMIGAALLLGGDLDDGDDESGADLGMRAVLLDTAGDAAAAAGVAGAGAVILATGGAYWLDPLVALLIGVAVGAHALRLVARVRRSLRS